MSWGGHELVDTTPSLTGRAGEGPAGPWAGEDELTEGEVLDE